MAGLLSVVATPIGNLGDITLRALETLKKADVIACEDTRVTAKLLARYEIQKPLTIFHARTPAVKADFTAGQGGYIPRRGGEKILTLLAEGKHVALVTDAGTPGISDPGGELVARARLAGVRIEVIPGASALAAALSIAGLDTSTFVFLGFLPHKKGRQTLFKEIAKEQRAVVFYESPHRIMKTLEAIAKVLAPKRQIAVCRELTKVYESVVRGTSAEVLAHYQANTGEVRGEFVVVVAP